MTYAGIDTGIELKEAKDLKKIVRDVIDLDCGFRFSLWEQKIEMIR